MTLSHVMPEGVGSARLNGRRALVSGGGSGIGMAVALRLAAEGASVAVADVRGQLAENVAEQVRREQGQAIGLTVDVCDEQSVAEATQRAADEWRGLDIVVSCAGVLHATPTHELDLGLWELTVRVNLTGTFLTIKHGLGHLLEGGGGSIVTIGSVASIVAGGYSASYDASKGGVLQLTRAVAVEYAGRGIRANCVCPGAVSTNLKTHSHETLGAAPGTGAEAPTIMRITPPMTRRADPVEIAAAVAFLCSDDASFITGTAMMVDGGFTAI